MCWLSGGHGVGLGRPACRKEFGVNARLRIAVPIAVLASLGTGMNLSARSGDSPGDVTFTKDIAPILQRSCQQCHRPDGVAPMSLVSYEDVRPWARAMKVRTGLGPRAGVMPPWFVE